MYLLYLNKLSEKFTVKRVTFYIKDLNKYSCLLYLI
jgi:hypothetical protein